MPNVAAKTELEQLPVQTYPLPQVIGTAPFTRMATAYGLRVVKLGKRTIAVEGHEDDLAAFADRLAQLRRLCR
jgi:hypothetical protein